MEDFNYGASPNTGSSRINAADNHSSLGNDFHDSLRTIADIDNDRTSCNGNNTTGADHIDFIPGDATTDTLAKALQTKGLSAKDASDVAREAINQIKAQGGDVHDPDQLKAALLDAQDTLDIQNPLSETDVDDLVTQLTAKLPNPMSFQAEGSENASGGSGPTQ